MAVVPPDRHRFRNGRGGCLDDASWFNLKPGQLGTKGLLARYGKKSGIGMTNRTKQWMKTVKVIVDRSSWPPEARHCRCASRRLVRVGDSAEGEGSGWEIGPAARVWRLSREHVESLGLENRIVEGAS